MLSPHNFTLCRVGFLAVLFSLTVPFLRCLPLWLYRSRLVRGVVGGFCAVGCVIKS